MKAEELRRPIITEFMGDGFTLNKAHKQYLENLELWNYVQALDKYADNLEALQATQQQVDEIPEFVTDKKREIGFIPMAGLIYDG